MSKLQRIFVILHLCLTFTVIVWVLGSPFLSQLYTFRQRAQLYQQIMGSEELAEKLRGNQVDTQRKRLLQNRIRFSNLPEEIQDQIVYDYNSMQEQTHRPFKSKLSQSIHSLLFDLHPFLRAWLTFSLILSLMLLFDSKTAKKLVWILPFIITCYTADLFFEGGPPSNPPDAHLFPTEEKILTHYLNEPLAPTIAEQREQLIRGWQTFVVDEWVAEAPSTDPHQLQKQVEEAEFRFHLNRLKEYPPSFFQKSSSQYSRPSFFVLILYLLWNLFFATIVCANFLPTQSKD